MRRALIACGGTGGHLSPGIALAEELAKREWESELLISGKQVDSRLVKKYHDLRYDAIPGSGLSARPRQFIRFSRDLLSGYRYCSRKIVETKPDVVVGFGGFISAPALLAGRRNGVPVAIHEANQVPGRVTRFVSRFADRIYLPEGVSIGSRRASRVSHVGMPVRSEFKRLSRSDAKATLGFDPMKKLLVVFGGSQGAESLNQWARESLDTLSAAGIQMLCLTGMQGESTNGADRSAAASGEARMVFQAFSDRMAETLSAADLAVSRAGAGSIAELARCRTPSFLVPYPLAADDHQRVNAKRLEESGGGLKVENSDLNTLLDRVVSLLGDDAGLGRMRACLETLDPSNPQSTMAADLERIISKRSS